MTKHEREDQTMNNADDISTSPQPPSASPAPPASPQPPNSNNPRDDAPSPPIMLATMTPVSVIELQKDFCDDNSQKQEMYVIPENDKPYDSDDAAKQSVYDQSEDEQQLQETLVATPSPNNATVSVVVQQPTLLTQAYQQPGGTGTTVLVLSELVEDLPSVIGIRKRKDLGEEYLIGNTLPPRTGTPLVRLSDMPPAEPGGGDDGNWPRSYYEQHPIAAATNAMLNIGGSGGGSGGEDNNQSMGLIYEYATYKLPQIQVGDRDGKLDIWPTTSTASGGHIFTSQLKTANGLAGGAGHDLIPPPTSTSFSGSASPGSTVASAADLQNLFLHQQHLHHPLQQLMVKREPEDLSHHRQKNSASPGLDAVATGGIIGGGKTSVIGRKVVLVSAANGDAGAAGDLVVDVVNNNIKEELPHPHRGLHSPQHGSRSINGTPNSTTSSLLADGGAGSGPIELIATADGLKPMSYSTQIFTHGGGSGTPSPIPYADQYTTSAVSQAVGGGYVTTSASSLRIPGSTAFAVADPYYTREYFTSGSEQGYGQVRQQIPTYADSPEGGTTTSTASFVERYVVRPSSAYHSNKGVVSTAGLTVDLPSPDSGIGTDAMTPRDQNAMQQSFDSYSDLCQAGPLLNDPTLTGQRAGTSPSGSSSGGRRPWHDFGRPNDADKIQIPKTYSNYGFKYHLETPISTSQRREDDRITYINKGQFYGITLEYIHDPDKPLKAQTVKSVVMLMFREEKSPEDEIKAWQFWHGRQHSVKQRILDAGKINNTKNSVGLIGCIEEVAHNAIAVYWNPLESSAKINIAVQCLSTDFSSQKGVKGLPLHLQIDTYEDPRDGPVYHRGYCQIKVFCDKGAERKTRDEERRAAKRKMTATGRKKIDELYHPPCERSEFYSMSDLTKPPVLFSPAEDIDKLTSMELQGFYTHDPDNSSLSNGESGTGLGKGSPFLLHSSKPTTTQTLKFHNHFPPDMPGDKKESVLDSGLTTDGTVFSTPPIKRTKLMTTPSIDERVMLYVRQDSDDVYTPLHVVPPTTQGLLNADYSQN